jgi:hypothetical protein
MRESEDFLALLSRGVMVDLKHTGWLGSATFLPKFFHSRHKSEVHCSENVLQLYLVLVASPNFSKVKFPIATLTVQIGL